jgi:recombination protein RecA
MGLKEKMGRKTAAKKAPAKSPVRGKSEKKKKSDASTSDDVVVAVRKKLKQKKRDESNIRLLSEQGVLSEVKEWIPTGFAHLDLILGGGWAVGRASEVFGPEGSGKSALSHLAIRSCQRAGGSALLLDFEVALDPDKMKQLQISAKSLIYATPSDIEEGWDIVWATLDQLVAKPPKKPFLIVWDSIAGSVPRAELEESSSSDAHVALIAKAMSKGCRKMYRQIAKVRAHMMWVNQIRDRFGGSSFIKQTETPGGRAVKFAASQRVDCHVIKRRRDAGQEADPTGYTIKTSTVKSRLFPPHRKAEWVLDFTYGPSPEMTMWHFLMEARIIKVGGGGYYNVPWTDMKFKKTEWMKVLGDEDFRIGAELALKAAVEAQYLAPPEESETEE